MGFVEKIKEGLIAFSGGMTLGEAGRLADRAYESGHNDGGNDEPPSGDLRSFGYRRQTTGGLRDFSKVDPDRLLNVIWSLYQSSPLAEWMSRIKKDHLIGGAVKSQTDDTELQEILDKFWADNSMPVRIEEFTLQLYLFGLQCFPVFVRETDGRVRLGYIDPSLIKEIKSHPHNAMIMVAVVLKEDGGRQQIYRIIRQDEDLVQIRPGPDGEPLETVLPAQFPGKMVTHKDIGRERYESWELDMLRQFGRQDYTGSCLYFKVNALSNQSRGVPDMTQVADWIDQNDQTLFSLADREQMNGYFFADVKVEEVRDIEGYAKKRGKRAPKKGSVNFHTDKETWDLTTPDLRQNPSIDTHNALLKFALGGKGIPFHWYGDGSDTNRATAAEANSPAWRMLSSAQRTTKMMFLSILQFVSDQAEIADFWLPGGKDEDGKEVDSSIDLTMPEIAKKNLKDVADTMAPVSNGLTSAEDSKWITRETAAKAWAKVMAELGIEYDVVAELSAIDAQDEQAALDGQAARNQALADKLAGNGAVGSEKLIVESE